MTQKLNPAPLAGLTHIPAKDWRVIEEFIHSRIWLHPSPALNEDSQDPLLAQLPPYGAFMLGFDFHLSAQGPKLIEINTNAGGLASLIETCPDEGRQRGMRSDFITALEKEYQLSGHTHPLRHIAIVDENISGQWLYPEMVYYSELLKEAGYQVTLATPQDLSFNQGRLCAGGAPVDFIYNRLTDFRLSAAAHRHIRQAALDQTALLSPHPAVYVRVADKRNLLRTPSPVVPRAYLLSDKKPSEWEPIRKKFVFKPLTGAASKGVYRGDRISLVKLSTLPPDTLVQELIPPPHAEDGSKYDIRVFTRDNDILGVASRHFHGQVMEMRSEGSGIRWALIDD